MGKSNVALNTASAIIADELGVKPSRTVRQVRALATLATLVRDVAPRKGSEGRRPETEVKDWETPLSHGPVSWGYVVAGSPKRVIALPDCNPEYWALVQGEILLGHVTCSFARTAGEEFDYINGRASRITPAAIVQRYLKRFADVNRRLTDHLEVRFDGFDGVTVTYLEWDDVAEDVNPTSSAECGSARTLVEFLTAMDYKAEEEGRRGRNYR
jgi:hypothetical protein